MDLAWLRGTTVYCVLLASHVISANHSSRAIGCILGELLNSSPLFPVCLPCHFVPTTYCLLSPHQGENDIDQLCCVLRVLGTPDEVTWPVGVHVIPVGQMTCDPASFPHSEDGRVA